MRWWLSLLLLLLLALPAHAATRLGLLVTQEELTIWRTRMTSSATINGVTFQSIYQNRLLADANLFRAQSHPGGDGFWVGYTGAGCLWLDLNSSEANEPHGSRFFRGNGADLNRSAFVYLLTGDVSYATPVKTELLNQIAQAGTDWANTSKFCLSQSPPAGKTYLTPFEFVPWLMRLLLAYDFLNAGGYTGFTPTQKTQIETWFTNAAVFFHGMEVLGYSFGCYQGIFSTPQDLTPIGGSPCSDNNLTLYFNGPTIKFATTWFFNQGTLAPLLDAAVGVLTNNATLKTYATKAVTAFLTVGLTDNGAHDDFSRWQDCLPQYECPGAMWAHAGGTYSALTQAMDILARTGDTSLYSRVVANQTLGQSGASVGWQKAVTLWAQMANKTTLLYGTTDVTHQTTARLLSWDTDIDPNNPGFVNTGNYYDFSSMAANLFYQDAAVTTAMSRTLKGTNTNLAPASCNDQQFGGCFSGVWGFWPDLPFLYGNMQGVVNPYNLSAGVLAPPTNLRVVP